MSKSSLMRMGEVLAETGFTEDYFMKLVRAEIVTPIYHVWRVRDERNAILMETTQASAQAEASRIGGTIEPVGRAWYARPEIEALLSAPKTV